jgi:transcriptional regulator with XRE-family HTH domain
MRTKQQKLIALGQRIRKIREHQEFSQEAFAEEAGISRSHYGCIERGQFALSLPKLIDIALALNVEVGELFPSLAELKKMSE